MNLCTSDKENYPMPVGFSMSNSLRYRTGSELSSQNCNPCYCERTILQQTVVNNYGNCESSLSFVVNKDAIIIGIQVQFKNLFMVMYINKFKG